MLCAVCNDKIYTCDVPPVRNTYIIHAPAFGRQPLENLTPNPNKNSHVSHVNLTTANLVFPKLKQATVLIRMKPWRVYLFLSNL